MNECEILLIHSQMGFLFPRSAEVKAIFLGFFVISHANENNMKTPQKGRALKELNPKLKVSTNLHQGSDSDPGLGPNRDPPSLWRYDVLCRNSSNS